LLLLLLFGFRLTEVSDFQGRDLVLFMFDTEPRESYSRNGPH